MIHVETVDLSSRGINFPSDRVGMVIAQPHLSLTSVEPYQCTAQCKAQQLEMINDVLAVARAARHGAPKTHFTVFPEYSIPGLDGITLVEAALNGADWPPGTIVIGGTDALSKPDFVTIAGEKGTHLDTVGNGLDRIGQNEWINCGITWVKGADGTVERWLQPKLFPAGSERNVQSQGMFLGNSVFTFEGPLDNGTKYHFCSLVCFDWIALRQNKHVWNWVLEAMQQKVAPYELSLSWFFVLQRNKKPSDDTFLLEVRNFFNQTIVPQVHRDLTCLVFANGAGKEVPGRAEEYGCTSLIFSKQTQFAEPTCHATFSNGGQRFRSKTLLADYRDIFFRERGACIHSFAQINPRSIITGAAGRKYPVENAFEFPILGTNDPRVPSNEVPASVKWLNDELDHLPFLSTRRPTAALATQTDAVHRQIVMALRVISPQSILNLVKLASRDSIAKNPDEWDSVEAESLEHLVHTLDIMGLGFSSLNVGANLAHATVIMNNQTVDLLAIRGASHEGCIEHSKSFLPLPRRQVLLISRDRDNDSWRQSSGSFLRTASPQLGQERNFTDTASVTLHIGYRNLLDIFQQSTTISAIQGAINAELNA